MPEAPPVRIVHLLEVPALAPRLADWFVRAWAPWYGPDGPGDAARDLADCADRDRIPLCLVALDHEGALVGTASLRHESVGDHLGLGPWLAAVLVDEDRRGRGIGTALVAAMEAEAARLGHGALFTSTDTAGRILARRGWRRIDEAESLRGTVAVYRVDLQAGTSTR